MNRQLPLLAVLGGAAAFFLVLFGLGLATCLAFRKDRALWRLEIGRDAAGGD